VLRIELERSVIRGWRLEDASSLLLYANNRNVWRNLYDVFPHPYTRQDADRWLALATTAQPNTHLAIEVGQTAVGGVGVTIGEGQFRHVGSVGFWLGEPYWGRGIMSEVLPAITADAFERLGLTRLSATVFEWNPASMRVFEKAGYSREGVLRRSIAKDGQILDQVVFAKLR
jgi:ribosomal-protein-alanine N-acetyltransferase